MRDLVSISRFALLTDLSPRLLRKLDERGVLRPAWVDPETRYRYYSYAQVRQGNLVRLARQFQLPAAELRALLASDDPAALRAALERHRGRLRQRLADLERLLGLLDHELRRSEVPFSYRCELRDEGGRRVACAAGAAPRLHPHDPLALEAEIERVGDAVFARLAALGVEPAGPPFVVYYDRPDEADRITFDVCVPLPPGTPPPATGPRVRVCDLPPATLAVTTHEGPYETAWNAYAALGLWVAEQGLEVCGPVRETGVVSALDTPDPTRWVTEIGLPVRRPEPGLAPAGQRRGDGGRGADGGRGEKPHPGPTPAATPAP